MAKIGLSKGSGKWLKVKEKSVKSQGIFKRIFSGNSGGYYLLFLYSVIRFIGRVECRV